MREPYYGLQNLWNRHLAGDRSNTEKDILALLACEGIGTRKDDGLLRQIMVSIPTSVSSAYVIGLRYLKRDRTQTEDDFSFVKGSPIGRYYKGILEEMWPEYRGAHKQQVDFTLVDMPTAQTMTNTICMLVR